MRITFGRSGAWRTPVGGPQPAASKQASRQSAISQRSRKRVRRRVLGGFLVGHPMRWRLYSTADSPWGGCRIWVRPNNMVNVYNDAAVLPGGFELRGSGVRTRTREERNPQPLGLRFRALHAEGGV